MTSYSSSRKIVEQLQIELRDVLNSEPNRADQSEDVQMNTRWNKTGSPIELNLSSNNIKELSTDDAKAFERLLENAQAWYTEVDFRSIGLTSSGCEKTEVHYLKPIKASLFEQKCISRNSKPIYFYSS